MSVPCGTVRDRLPSYLEDALGAEDRREFREHFASCEACRDEIARIEPSLLFMRVIPEEVASEDVSRILSGVRAGIALAETERRVGRSRGRIRRRAGALASAAALAALTLVVPGGGPAARHPREAVAAVPILAAPAPGFSPVTQPATSGTFPADATIYDWNPGAASEEPRVVWIVDRSLDI